MNIDNLFNEFKRSLSQKLSYGLSEVLANKYGLNKQDVQKTIAVWMSDTPIDYSKTEIPKKSIISDLESELIGLLEKEKILEAKEEKKKKSENSTPSESVQ